MAFYLCASLVVTLDAVVSVSSSPGVMEGPSSYSCCGSPEIRFNPRCEHHWSENGTTIAWSKGEDNGCSSPCQRIAEGRMTLDRCADVYSITTCSDEEDVAAEERIRYHGQPCSGSVSDTVAPQGSARVLLPAMILGVCTVMMIC